MRKKETRRREEVLHRLFKTRKAFLVEYGCGIFLIMIAFIASLKVDNLPGLILYPSLSLGIFAIVTAEFSRLFTRYKIMYDKLVIVHGLIKKHKKNVYFHPLGFVTDINTRQSYLQRLLSYGTIYVRGSDSENSFEIKDISHPHKVMEIIEDMVQRSKRV